MSIQDFKIKLKLSPSAILFSETIHVIEKNFSFSPTGFSNREINNKLGENSGSCKLLAFATVQKFTKEETLFCFGEHYKNVLDDANGTSHQNIRNFLKTGFDGLNFEGVALQSK